MVNQAPRRRAEHMLPPDYPPGEVQDWRPSFSCEVHLEVNDTELVQRVILNAAKITLRRACENGQLLPSRSPSWREVSSTILSPSVPTCPHCLRKCGKFRMSDRKELFRLIFGSKTETLFSCADHERHIAGLWSHHSELFDLLFGLNGRRKRASNDPMPHRHLFVRNVLVTPNRFRPMAMMGGSMKIEHPQNMFFQTLLKEIKVIMAASKVGH